MAWFNLIFRTILLFAILLCATKLMGKREIGQLSVFDFLIVLSVADIMIIGIENNDKSMLYSIIPMIVIVLLQKIIAFLCIKSTIIRDLMDGKESLIIKDGIVLLDVMRKEKYNMNDLYSQLREKDVRSIDEVEYAILENNGNLSVFKKNEINSFPLPVIISGKIIKDNLKLINKSEKWLINQIKRKHYNIKDVYGASYVNNEIVIIEVKKN